jgi:hypothetical protein
LVDQVEFANVLVLNKTDLASSDQLVELKRIFKKLNPGASIIESQFGVVNTRFLLNTKSFDLSSASMLPGWQIELSGVQHKPETEEYGISSFVYRKDRPFHPDRLEELLKHGSLPGVMRSKGYIWVASDHLVSVEWSQAGNYTNLKAGYSWLPLGYAKRSWPEPAKIKFKESPYGDRRQELVLIGSTMDETAIRSVLDGSLVTDEEFAFGPEVWTSWKKIITTSTLKPDDEGRDPEFTIDLVKKDGDSLGLQVDETEGIRIALVNPGGLVWKWNSENSEKHPELVVRVGYSITAVNGVKGSASMEMIRSSTNLRITISRLFAVSTQKRLSFPRFEPDELQQKEALNAKQPLSVT